MTAWMQFILILVLGIGILVVLAQWIRYHYGDGTVKKTEEKNDSV